MDLMSFVLTEYAILIVVLFGLGKIIKHTMLIADEYIPVILMIAGILFSISIGGFNAESIIQGIIICTTTVWGNEAVTQLSKK